ncbi:GLPGLI family protein [Flavobacterium sp. J49]|uniref:GLPGLI family protein n=1 Tax=Flavobacterium sp. J49 TaxID=2718534 RepID=UPI001594E668|nr:GLPGLI family protein [Flavobacterium sp. J49]MBF6641308.1 GLPGLI family protein [Flavobacterium sp. J49]NIC02555.1 GLPGLI family protein [Flavobacterium sp. J49]
MKRIYTMLLFLLITKMNAQMFNGSVIYSIKVGTDDLFEKLDKNLRESYIKDKESEVYTLNFDANKSIFKYDGGISIEGYNKSSKLYFKEKDSTYSLRPENDPDFGKIIILEDKNTKWELINETKIIDGYLCYKATSQLIRKNGENTFKFPIIAWYCPKIPIPFGPLGYGNLPGLILELQERNVLYGAKEIKFNLEKPESIVKPSEGVRIKQEELNKKIAEMFKRK